MRRVIGSELGRNKPMANTEAPPLTRRTTMRFTTNRTAILTNITPVQKEVSR